MVQECSRPDRRGQSTCQPGISWLNDYFFYKKNIFVQKICLKLSFISWDEHYSESILELAIRNWLMGYIEQSEIPIIQFVYPISVIPLVFWL